MSHLVVIGGTKGLGRAFVESLSGEFDAVTVLARSVPATADQTGPHYFSADAANPESLLTGLEQTFVRGGAFTAMALFQQFRGSSSPWEGKLATTLTASKLALDFFALHAAPTALLAVSSVS